jgi:RNA polymerase sigma-70 factor (sigma-E family)
MTAPPEGFADFVAQRSDALLRVAWLLTCDSATAEDLLQTALAEVWPRWRRISAGPSPEAYVRRVLVTRYLSSRRRRWWGEIPTGDIPEPDAGPDIASHSANRDAVRRALVTLPPQQRAVVVLRFAEDLSIEDTAAVLGCSPATVKVQAGRALTALRANPHLNPASAARSSA